MDMNARRKAALKRAASALGGQAAVAAACGYEDRRHVWPWFNTDRPVPYDRCAPIEVATAAKGVRVRCEELRPDLDWIRVEDDDPLWAELGRPALDATKAAA